MLTDKFSKEGDVTHVPVLSTATERTPPWWQSILTRASFWFGDQRVTVPLGWPRWMMALWGFWHITLSRPVLVEMAATSFPIDTSRYCRKPVALCRQIKNDNQKDWQSCSLMVNVFIAVHVFNLNVLLKVFFQVRSNLVINSWMSLKTLLQVNVAGN